MVYINTEGIVLKTVKYGETDAILTVFTKKLGKIGVYARGVRKMNSRMMSGSQPFTYAAFNLIPKATLFKVTSIDTINNFYDITHTIEQLYTGYYILELTEKTTVENQTNNRLFDLLLEVLTQLSKIQDPKMTKLIKLYYNTRITEYLGVKPDVLKCGNCGIEYNKANKTGFSIEDGTIICEKCMKTAKRYMYFDKTVYRLIDYIMNIPLKKLLTAYIEPSIFSQTNALITKYIHYHVLDTVLNTEVNLNRIY